MDTKTYEDIIAQPELSREWFATELPKGKICYLHNEILTQWTIQEDKPTKIIFKKHVSGSIPKDIRSAGFVSISKSDIPEEVGDCHKYASNFFDNKQEPNENRGSRGGRTTVIQLKSGQKKHRFNIMVDEDDYRFVNEFAKSQKMTRNQLIADILRNWVRSISKMIM